MPITLEQAKQLKPGDILHAERKNKRGECERWKVNGQVKTWKRNPNRVYVPLKHGLYSYGSLDELNLVHVHIPCESCK